MQDQKPLETTSPEWKKFIEKLLQEFGMKGSQDVGGHGGTFLAKITLPNGENHHLFLKPLDETEARNYAIIQEIAPEVTKFMPRVYGEIKIGPQAYLVMENTRIGKQDESLTQLADVKLAGKIGKENFNPIADQEEMKVTRGKEKGWFDYMQMQQGAESAPHYMLYVGKKLFRLFNFSSSETNLLNSLAGISAENLQKLNQRLKEMAEVLDASPVAFIGASLIFVKQSDGSVTPLLIDPAHIQVNEKQHEKIDPLLPKEDRKKVYYGNQTMYSDRKQSNLLAMRAIHASVVAKIAETVKEKGITTTQTVRKG